MRNLYKEISPRHLELIIFPTEQCNFRCTYCYEDFSIGKMKSETISALKALITNRFSKITTLKLSWFGGEPLLAKGIIKDIYEHVRSLNQKTDSPVRIYSHITTNAFYLDTEFLEGVAKHGPVSLQISLDGDREVHNTTRRKINGSGTFNEIWSNLIAIRESKIRFTCSLRLHLTPINIQSMYILAEKIKVEFLNDSRFVPYVMVVGDWGGPNKGKITTLTRESFVAHHKKINETLFPKRNSPDNPFKNLPVCYASKPNSLAIRADGRVGKCTVHLKDDRNTVGALSADGSIKLDNEKMMLWMRGLNTGEESVLACPAKQMPKLKSKIVDRIPVLQTS